MKLFLTDISGAGYTFDKTAKTVTLTGITTLVLNQVLTIVNATAGVMIYNIADAALNGTISSNVITLDYDTSAMNNADKLMIALDYPAQPVPIAGDVAHDAADSGNPVKAGGKAITTAFPTAVASADRTNLITDAFGRLLVGQIAPGQQIWKVGNYTTTQTGTAIWTPTSGKKVVITHLSVSAYATTAARVILWFGASGDTTYTSGTDQPVWLGSFAPSSTSKPGTSLMLPVPIFSTTADDILRITTDAGISVDVVVYGYEI